MTIDEAISHKERNVEINKLIGEVSDCEPTNAIAYHRQLAEWLNELKQLREQTRWIPVSERLPEESLNSVIGWDAFRERCVFVQFFHGCFQVIGKADSFDIKAWMPLPEPYKAESEGHK